MDLPLDTLLNANEAYRTDGFQLESRTPRPSGRIVILTCMDGQAHVLRNAGGRASDDAIRSLVVSTHLLETREVGVSTTPTAAWRGYPMTMWKSSGAASSCLTS